MTGETPPSYPRRANQYLADAALLVTAVAAIGWWWIMPRGFPLDHPRFWSNEVIPLVVAGLLAAAFMLKLRGRPRGTEATIAALVIFWSVALLASAVVFPISLRRIGPPVFVIAATWWLLFLVQLGWRAMLGRTFVLTALPAAGLAIAAVFIQRAPDADTHPLVLAALERLPSATSAARSPQSLSEDILVAPRDGAVHLRAGGITLRIEPLLNFVSRSPDRCWTIFAPRPYRESRPWQITGASVSENRLQYQYQGSEAASLDIQRKGDQSLLIESQALLSEAVYSHLNSFCELVITGHEQLQLEFSPAPGVLIDVLPADYPVGRPARFAYVDTRDEFHVVQASIGEKGPFIQLGRGPLANDAPLTITIYDSGAPIYRISFDDWASQAGRSLSPTAGWEVPVNAIEFQMLDDSHEQAAIWMTLSGTSVGRGWDSVGHRAGTYRNRIRVEGVAAPANSE